jgi:hypothetical protein
MNKIVQLRAIFKLNRTDESQFSNPVIREKD